MKVIDLTAKFSAPSFPAPPFRISERAKRAIEEIERNQRTAMHALRDFWLD